MHKENWFIQLHFKLLCQYYCLAKLMGEAFCVRYMFSVWATELMKSAHKQRLFICFLVDVTAILQNASGAYWWIFNIIHWAYSI